MVWSLFFVFKVIKSIYEIWFIRIRHCLAQTQYGKKGSLIKYANNVLLCPVALFFLSSYISTQVHCLTLTFFLRLFMWNFPFTLLMNAKPGMVLVLTLQMTTFLHNNRPRKILPIWLIVARCTSADKICPSTEAGNKGLNWFFNKKIINK